MFVCGCVSVYVRGHLSGHRHADVSNRFPLTRGQIGFRMPVRLPVCRAPGVFDAAAVGGRASSRIDQRADFVCSLLTDAGLGH